MTREEIEQKAELYAELLTAGNKEHYRTIYTAAKEGYVTGAISRDEEIKELKEEIESLQEQYNTCFDGFTKRGTKLGELMKENVKLRNPWISVEDSLPEEPFSIGSNRSKEVYVRTAKGCNYIASYNFNRKDWNIVKDGYVELTNDNVIKWMPIPD